MKTIYTVSTKRILPLFLFILLEWNISIIETNYDQELLSEKRYHVKILLQIF